MIEIVKGVHRIWISDAHAVYRETMERDFDHYFNAVESIAHPTFGEHVRVVDFTKPAAHQIRGFDEFPIMCSSFAEPYATAERYVELAALEPGDCVWDLGAYVGVAAIAFERALHGEGAVVAVEPDPQNFTCLLENTIRRGSTIRLMPAAVADFSGAIAFCADSSMGAALAMVVNNRTPAIGVHAFSLQDLSLVTSTYPSVIKMDIEGAELLVLREARAFLTAPALTMPRLIIEPHRVAGTWLTELVVDLLTSYGYTCRLEAQPGQTTPLIVAHAK